MPYSPVPIAQLNRLRRLAKALCACAGAPRSTMARMAVAISWRGDKLKRPVLPALNEFTFDDAANLFRFCKLRCMSVEEIGGNLAERRVLPALCLSLEPLFLVL